MTLRDRSGVCAPTMPWEILRNQEKRTVRIHLGLPTATTRVWKTAQPCERLRQDGWMDGWGMAVEPLAACMQTDTALTTRMIDV